METQALSENRRARRKRAGAARALCAGAAMWLLSSAPAPAQTPGDMQKILERLDRLEEQNKALTAEVHALREELAAARGAAPTQASTEERLGVQESRTAELAASKVEASQRFPIRLTGMVLFNSFFNSKGSGGYEYPTTALAGDTGSGGATVRQTVLGLDYSGPQILGGGKVNGSLRMDFWGGSGSPLGQEVRLRTATVSIDWTDSSFLVGVDKPIISPREPESLAQVAVSPLAGAGNLWLWIPQARFEQDFHFTDQTGLKAQVGMVGTHEVGASPASPYAPAGSSSEYIEPTRPGIEARVELFSGGEDSRIEIASGIHHSVSHVLGESLSSDVLSFDWFARLWRPLEFTGAFFSGQNVAPLGTGGINQGFVALGPGLVTSVHSLGGWGQLTLRPSSRLWFNFFSGQQDDRNSQLPMGAIGKNLAYGANFFYRLAPNVLASFEASQTRTQYIGSGALLNNHYDLALAYLF
ncbi:MAG TPA: hypothetical protein VGF05_20430 [Bryobacteraceae bacterium]|jgi:hypothetical protein